MASLLSRSATEKEIAQQLGVDRSTINRDIRALKIECQRFVYDLAKSDLAYYYKQSIDGIEEVPDNCGRYTMIPRFLLERNYWRRS